MSAVQTVGYSAAAVALLVGGMLALLAGLGLVRPADTASRLRAAAKPQVLGLVLVCAGEALLIGGGEARTLILVVLFQFATAPIMAQLVGCAAYRSGAGRGSLVVDELRDRGR